MKKMICFAVACLFCLCCGCTAPNQELAAEYTVPSDSSVSSTPSDGKEPVPAVDNKTPYRQLLTKEVDIHAFMQKYCIKSYDGQGNIADIAADIGIECLRKTDAGGIYSIHPVKQGGLLYIFYYDYQGQVKIEEASVLRCIYMQKKLSSKDFASMRIGMTLEELKQIDPVAQIGANLYHSAPDWWEGCQTIHYLTDGILECAFREENGILRLHVFYLAQDFNLPQNSGVSHPYNGAILPQDWLEE